MTAQVRVEMARPGCASRIARVETGGSNHTVWSSTPPADPATTG